ncbi:MAG: helix-turn-helix domain-containing protein [Haloarculaceae archaeon]
MSSEQHTKTAWADEQRAVEIPLFADAETALHATRDIVGRKWHPVLLFYLFQDGPLGFSALKERTDGISSKMLSESLSDLEDAGLVTRELLDDQPVRVEYAVSERGETLGPVIEAMVDWGLEGDGR